VTRVGLAARSTFVAMVAVAVIAAIVVSSQLAAAHPAPSSSVALTFASRSVQAKLLLPVSELTYAMTDVASQDPGSAHIDERALRHYVATHVSAESHDGAPWSVTVRTVKADTLDDHDYWIVDMMLTPPPDGDVSDLVLVDDAITREIRNHFIFATARDGEAAGTAADVVGILQYPTSRLSIPRTTSRIHAAHAHFGSVEARLALLALLALLAGALLARATARRRRAPRRAGPPHLAPRT
jgi:hypothetical protein